MLDRWRDNNAAAAAVNLFGRHRKNKLEAVFVEKKCKLRFVALTSKWQVLQELATCLVENNNKESSSFLKMFLFPAAVSLLNTLEMPYLRRTTRALQLTGTSWWSPDWDCHSPHSSISIWTHASTTWTSQMVIYPSNGLVQCFFSNGNWCFQQGTAAKEIRS